MWTKGANQGSTGRTRLAAPTLTRAPPLLTVGTRPARLPIAQIAQIFWATISLFCTAEALCVQGSACTRTRCSSRVSTRSSPTTRPRRRPARRHSSSSVRHDHLNDIEDFCGPLGSLSGMVVGQGRRILYTALCRSPTRSMPSSRSSTTLPARSITRWCKYRFVCLCLAVRLANPKSDTLQQLDRRRNRPRGGRLEDVRAVRGDADLLQCGQRRPAPHGE